MIVVGACLLAMVRNRYVYKFRMWMLKEVSENSKKDIAEHKDFMWRYHAMDTVSYNEMVYKFWKPLRPEAFYKNTLFLDL